MAGMIKVHVYSTVQYSTVQDTCIADSNIFPPPQLPEQMSNPHWRPPPDTRHPAWREREYVSAPATPSGNYSDDDIIYDELIILMLLSCQCPPRPHPLAARPRCGTTPPPRPWPPPLRIPGSVKKKLLNIFLSSSNIFPQVRCARPRAAAQLPSRERARLQAALPCQVPSWPTRPPR